MKRGYVYYAAFLVVALLIGIAVVRSLTVSEYQRALRKLGRADREFREARNALVLATGDPTLELLDFVSSDKESRRSRMHALSILKELSRHRPMHTEGERLAPLLKNDSPEFVVAVLEAMEQMKVPGAAGELWEVFSSATDSLVFAHSYLALRAAMEPLAKRMEQAMRLDDEAAIDSCLGAMEKLPGGKANVYRELRGRYLTKGDSARARDLARRCGFVDTCWVVGPFDNTGRDAFSRDFGPENRPFSAADVFKADAKTTARWSRVSQTDSRGNINFNNIFSKRCCSVGYLFTYVVSPEERDALLLLAYWEPLRVWFNDSPVRSQRVYRGSRGDDDAVRVRLKRGTNTLLIKSVQDLSTWRVACRVVDFSGEAIEGIRLSWNPASEGVSAQTRDK